MNIEKIIKHPYSSLLQDSDIVCESSQIDTIYTILRCVITNLYPKIGNKAIEELEKWCMNIRDKIDVNNVEYVTDRGTGCRATNKYFFYYVSDTYYIEYIMVKKRKGWFWSDYVINTGNIYNAK